MSQSEFMTRFCRVALYAQARSDAAARRSTVHVDERARPPKMMRFDHDANRQCWNPR